MFTNEILFYNYFKQNLLFHFQCSFFCCHGNIDTFYILKMQGLKIVCAKPSHNAIAMNFSLCLYISLFSSENSTLVKILHKISLDFRLMSISSLILGLEFIAFSPLGYQLPC